MLKKMMAVCLTALLIPAIANAEGISWFNGVGYLCFDGGAYLTGHLTDSSVGCFVQLLWVGANGVADNAYADGSDGTGTTDDEVVSTIWVGYGVGDNGYFNAVNVPDGDPIIEDRVYFARAWNAASPNYASGIIPSGGAVRYLNSPTWTYPKSDPTFDDFDIAPAGDLETELTPLAIPEPGVLALVALGLIGLRLTRKQR